MTMLRARREASGLVQMNVWIRADDTEAFRAAVRPFRQRAKELEERGRPVRMEAPAPPAQASHKGSTVRFTKQVPPATVRDRMKASGWSYDRAEDAWVIGWPRGAAPADMQFLGELRGQYGADVTLTAG